MMKVSQVKVDHNRRYNTILVAWILAGFNLLRVLTYCHWQKNIIFSTVTSCKISLASVVAPIFNRKTKFVKVLTSPWLFIFTNYKFIHKPNCYPYNENWFGHYFRNFVCSLTCNELKRVCYPNQGAGQKLSQVSDICWVSECCINSSLFITMV